MGSRFRYSRNTSLPVLTSQTQTRLLSLSLRALSGHRSVARNRPSGENVACLVPFPSLGKERIFLFVSMSQRSSES